MLVFHADYPNNSEDANDHEEAIDYARGMCWGEVESSEQTISHYNHVETVQGVGVYYCYGTDSYFFTDES